MKGQQKGQDEEEVLVEDITKQPKTKWEEYEPTKTVVEGQHAIGQKIKLQDAAKITLPYISDAVVTMEVMLGKVSKVRYLGHDVCNMTKLLDLAEEEYLAEIWEIRPIGRPIMEPMQWITWLYNYEILNLLDILHFGNGKNVGLCVKKLLARVHGGIR
jgi:hypothetical protein